MKKLLLFVLLNILIISCSPDIWEGVSILSNSIKIKKQVVKIMDICKSECNNNKKYSDEWCDCMTPCSNNVNDERQSLVKIAKY